MKLSVALATALFLSSAASSAAKIDVPLPDRVTVVDGDVDDVQQLQQHDVDNNNNKERQLQYTCDHQWQNFRWNTDSIPFISHLSSSLYDTAGYNVWNNNDQSNGANSAVSFSSVTLKNPTANCQPTLGTIVACDYDYGRNGWLGLARVWTYRDGTIAQGK